MDISQIHFHDTVILKVEEDSVEDTMTFEVEYPADWDAKVFERRWIVFNQVLDYRVSEGPFHGAPTILEVNIIGQNAERRLLEIVTNAGTRFLSCVDVQLLDHKLNSHD